MEEGAFLCCPGEIAGVIARIPATFLLGALGLTATPREPTLDGWRFTRMKKLIMLHLVLSAVALLAGCQEQTIFASRQLDTTDMNGAMAAAQAVMGQYMPIYDVDQFSHKIQAGPITASGEAIGIFSKADYRQRGTLRLRREDNSIWADVSVVVERQTLAADEYGRSAAGEK